MCSQHEVFLIDSIERARSDKMAHLKAIYFVRPTHENVRLLQEEFKEPKYGEYHIFFSNTTRDTMIQQLAEADEHEVVQQVLRRKSEHAHPSVPRASRRSGAASEKPAKNTHAHFS